MARVRPLSYVAAIVATLAVLAPLDAAGQKTDARDALIDVPYLTQSESLCGGAALAMVMRYWGATDVFAQDFSGLIDRDANGIKTEALLGAARDRNFRASVLAPGTRSVEAMRDAIRRGQPIIALIEDRPKVFHYVVVAGATGDSVVLHDPARAPYRVMKAEEFERRSAAADRWMAIVHPAAAGDALPSGPPAATRASRALPAASAPCDGLVDQAIALSEGGDIAGAEAQLLTATQLCAASAKPWRELAGLRFKQERYSEARDFALRATQLAPNDAYAWQLLATSRFLTDDTTGALEAWQQGSPMRVGVVNVIGARRIDHPVVVALTGLEPREALTPDIYWRAKRRLDDLPALSSASVIVEPGPDGFATVRAVVDETPMYPTGVRTLGAIGMKAIFTKEIGAKVAGVFKQGETIGGAYRWSPNRRRLRGEFALPAPGFLPGIATLDGLWEEFTFTPAVVPLREASVGDLRQVRRRAGLHLADWSRGWLHWNVGGGVDRFDTTTHAVIDGAVDLRFAEDRVAFGVAGSAWSPLGGDEASSFTGVTLMGAWRSTAQPATPVLTAYAGTTVMSDAAPEAIWQGAGTADNRPGLLRAHRLHRGGIINSTVLGRGLAFTTVEYSHPIYSHSMASLAVAGFVDVARAWRRADQGVPSDWLTDIGVGLRILTGRMGAIRMDVAFNPQDRRRAFSAGYVTAWPRLFSGAW